jgi:AcrR family transcriptional regulator
MVQAAYRVFCAEGYLGTTMKAVANEAGVAVQTLYYTFHTKATLLDETIGAAVVGFDLWREPPTDPALADLLPWLQWWAAFEAATSRREALDVFIVHGVHILERVGPLVAAMHGAAGDPDAASVVRVAEERRVEAYQEAVRVLARKPGGLRRGVSEATATDLLVVLFSAELHQALSAGRGWSRARCTSFFRQLLTTQLLGAEPPD